MADVCSICNAPHERRQPHRWPTGIVRPMRDVEDPMSIIHALRCIIVEYEDDALAMRKSRDQARIRNAQARARARHTGNGAHP